MAPSSRNTASTLAAGGRQLDLCLIAIMATFGWEKALGDDDELDWWHNRVTEAAARRGIAVGRAGG